jgi:hypothetical protein
MGGEYLTIFIYYKDYAHKKGFVNFPDIYMICEGLTFSGNIHLLGRGLRGFFLTPQDHGVTHTFPFTPSLLLKLPSIGNH